MPITATTIGAQVRAWMDRHPHDPVPRDMVARLLGAIDRDRLTHDPPIERLGLAEGWLTLAEVARAAGETVDEAKARIYGRAV